jgi:uncharacterized protein YdeI (YjbR/CyaY-like superfamily)
MNAVFFASPSEWRAWLEQHHDDTRELWVGFYKKGSGRPGITRSEAVDEALCFGWIDGVAKGVDDVSWAMRFTPRRPRSNWSAVNIKRVGELTELGRMHPAGLDAFEKRSRERSGVYSHEQRDLAALGDAYERRFRANAKAWEFFQAQTDWYRRGATWWVVSAKKEATRLKRLATLIDDSEHGRTIAPMTRPGRRG